MSQYGTDARKSMAQIADEPFHRLLLCRCPGVGDAAVLVQTALITDADGVTVPAPGVGAHALYRATRVDDAIQRDIVMVAESVHPFTSTWSWRNCSSVYRRLQRDALQCITIMLIFLILASSLATRSHTQCAKNGG